jgi:hypothetical protein
MFEKKKADKIPDDFLYSKTDKLPSIELWFKDRDFWSNMPSVNVQGDDFKVDEENHQLYVSKTAMTSTLRWGIRTKNVRISRIHDGWLSAEFPDDITFELSDVKDSKHYRLINILYKISRVDNVVNGWWMD